MVKRYSRSKGKTRKRTMNSRKRMNSKKRMYKKRKPKTRKRKTRRYRRILMTGGGGGGTVVVTKHDDGNYSVERFASDSERFLILQDSRGNVIEKVNLNDTEKYNAKDSTNKLNTGDSLKSFSSENVAGTQSAPEAPEAVAPESPEATEEAAALPEAPDSDDPFEAPFYIPSTGKAALMTPVDRVGNIKYKALKPGESGDFKNITIGETFTCSEQGAIKCDFEDVNDDEELMVTRDKDGSVGMIETISVKKIN